MTVDAAEPGQGHLLFEVEHDVEPTRGVAYPNAHWHALSENKDPKSLYVACAMATVSCIFNVVKTIRLENFSVVVNRKLLQPEKMEGYQGVFPSAKEASAPPLCARARSRVAARYPRPGSFEVKAYDVDRGTHVVLFSKYKAHRFPCRADEFWDTLLPFLTIFACHCNHEQMLNLIAVFARAHDISMRLLPADLEKHLGSHLLLDNIYDGLQNIDKCFDVGDPEQMQACINCMPHGFVTVQVHALEARIAVMRQAEKRIEEALEQIWCGLATSGLEMLRKAVQAAQEVGLDGLVMRRGQNFMASVDQGEPLIDPIRSESPASDDVAFPRMVERLSAGGGRYRAPGVARVRRDSRDFEVQVDLREALQKDQELLERHGKRNPSLPPQVLQGQQDAAQGTQDAASAAGNVSPAPGGAPGRDAELDDLRWFMDEVAKHFPEEFPGGGDSAARKESLNALLSRIKDKPQIRLVAPGSAAPSQGPSAAAQDAQSQLSLTSGCLTEDDEEVQAIARKQPPASPPGSPRAEEEEEVAPESPPSGRVRMRPASSLEFDRAATPLPSDSIKTDDLQRDADERQTRSVLDSEESLLQDALWLGQPDELRSPYHSPVPQEGRTVVPTGRRFAEQQDAEQPDAGGSLRPRSAPSAMLTIRGDEESQRVEMSHYAADTLVRTAAEAEIARWEFEQEASAVTAQRLAGAALAAVITDAERPSACGSSTYDITLDLP